MNSNLVWTALGLSLVAIVIYMAFMRRDKNPREAAQDNDADGPEFFISTRSESEARANSVLPSEGSEDVSHLLVPPTLFDFPHADSDDSGYWPSSKFCWIMHVDFEGASKLRAGDVLEVFSRDWSSDWYRPDIFGYSPQDDHWAHLYGGIKDGAYTKLRFSIQLFDSYREEQPWLSRSFLAGLKKSVQSGCRKLGNPHFELRTSAEQGEQQATELRTLFELCNRDAIIVLRAPSDRMYEGRDIWDVMQCLGLSWGDMDQFHWRNSTDAGDENYFSVWSSTSPGYFFPEDIAAGQVQTADLVFGFSIPRCAAPSSVLNEMVKAVSYAQGRLGGTVLDGQGRTFDKNKMLEEINRVVGHLEKAGIDPGGDAQLIF